MKRYTLRTMDSPIVESWGDSSSDAKRRRTAAGLQRGIRGLASRARTAALAAAVLTGPAFQATVAPPAVRAGGPCDTYVPSCGDGLCDCGSCDAPGCDGRPTNSRRRLLENPLYRTLDTVAGGIETVLGLNKCDHSACDAATCDAAPWHVDAGHVGEDWNGPVVHAHPHTVAPGQVPSRVMPGSEHPRLPVVPELSDDSQMPELIQPREVPPQRATPRALPEPRKQQRSSDSPQPGKAAPTPSTPPATEMSQPRIVPSQPRSSSQPKTSPRDTQPMPQPEVDPAPEDIPQIELPEMTLPESKSEPSPPKKESNNPFDTLPEVEELNDPFSEDAARLRSPYGMPTTPTGLRSSAIPQRRGIRPSSYPAPTQPGLRLMPPAKTSAAPIGSGLRPVSHAGPLRPVNHEEPVVSQPRGLQPLGGGVPLPPYRPSR